MTAAKESIMIPQRDGSFISMAVRARWLVKEVVAAGALVGCLWLHGLATAEEPPVAKPVPRSVGGAALHDLGRAAFRAAGSDKESRRRAAELLEKAVEAEPKNDLFRLDLADAYLLLGHERAVAAAIDLYEDVLSRRPEDDRLLARLVTAYTILENGRQAFAYAERRLAIITADDAYSAATQVAAIVVAGGELSRGIALARKAVALAPEDKSVALLLATLLSEQEDRTEAKAILQKVLAQCDAKDPFRKPTLKMLARLEGKP
jgi:predicted Zn-dependent protease